MPVQNSNYRVDHVCDGIATVFNVDFYFLASEHLQVIHTDANGDETELTLNTDYTVSGVRNPPGGNITTIATYPADHRLSILRNVPLNQLVSYLGSQGIPRETLQDTVDKLAMQVQQLQEQINRSLKFSPGYPGAGVNFPEPFPGSFPRWDDFGNLINADEVTVAGSYQLPVPGAKLRSIASKLQEFVSVKDLGAVGDGLTNDNGAFQLLQDFENIWQNYLINGTVSTFQSAGGGVVKMPPGVYRISSSVQVNQAVTHYQGPCVILIDPGVTAFDYVFSGSSDKTGVTFDKVCFVGGARAVRSGNHNVWSPVGAYNCMFINQTEAGIEVGSFSFGIKIRDNIFTGCKHGFVVDGEASDGLLLDHNFFLYNTDYDCVIKKTTQTRIINNSFVGNQKTPASDSASVLIDTASSGETGSYTIIEGNKFGQEGRTGGACVKVIGTSTVSGLAIKKSLFHFESSTPIGYGVDLGGASYTGLVIEDNTRVYCQTVKSDSARVDVAGNGQNEIGINPVITGGAWNQLLQQNFQIREFIEPVTTEKKNILRWSRYVNSGGDFTYANATPSYMTEVDENGIANNATAVLATSVLNTIRYNSLNTNSTQKFYTLSIWMKLSVDGSVTLSISRSTNIVLSKSFNLSTTWKRLTIDFYQQNLATGFPYNFDITIPDASTITLGGVCVVPGGDVGDLRAADDVREVFGLGVSSAAAPDSVYWTAGTISFNNAPAVGQPIGWMCTVSGNPGTWVALANL
jgi:hypothetical protein